jgi:hypothetical protein
MNTIRTNPCAHCAGPVITGDQLCPLCANIYAYRTAEQIRARRQQRQQHRTAVRRRSGPLRHLTDDTPGHARAERWFAGRTLQLDAINKNRTIQQRCAKYGLTVGEWMVLIADQSSRCAICGRTCEPLMLCIDHDHHSNRVRGLLCTSCNTGLGLLGIDGISAPDRATAVINYIRKATRRGPFPSASAS